MGLVRDLIVQRQQVDRALAAAVEREYPDGRRVAYRHGSHERSGVVNMRSDDRVRILTPGGAQVWIDVWKVEDHARPIP